MVAVFKPYIIRMNPNDNRWYIFKTIETKKIVRFICIADLETFSDVLVLLNCGVVTVGY